MEDEEEGRITDTTVFKYSPPANSGMQFFRQFMRFANCFFRGKKGPRNLMAFLQAIIKQTDYSENT